MSAHAKSWMQPLSAMALVGLTVVFPALAADGVIEINDARARAGGVSSGDAPGYPVTLSGPGSYRLTGNLYSLDTGRTVLEVTAHGVSVDLTGFEIAPCVPGALCGTGEPEGYGLKASGQLDVRVRNGRIRDMKLMGIDAGDRAHIESVQVVDSGDIGVSVGSASRVLGNTLAGNAKWGLFAGFGSVVTGNTAYQNLWGGLWAVASTLRGNSAYDNDGIGLKAASHCTVVENSVFGNGGVGLELSANAGYGDNVLGVNGGGNVTGGKPLGTNLCDGATCTSPRRRRFYLTTTTHNGAQADEPGVCAPGFHFASLFEIWDPSGLDYDTSLGMTGGDSPWGPPGASGGWVRTGFRPWIEPGASGLANCDAWSSAVTDDHGSAAVLTGDWTGLAIPSGIRPYDPTTFPCSDPFPVWCIQN